MMIKMNSDSNMNKSSNDHDCNSDSNSDSSGINDSNSDSIGYSNSDSDSILVNGNIQNINYVQQAAVFVDRVIKKNEQKLTTIYLIFP
ncbi:hypothetical protein M0813_03260 [Anaeramoeba flamelloides]|uniref:Uncharacterized protein n=1 Tax=Anaeramoeba flamelloides TaxID=1746091 RepID=A0ABQ8XZK6_9EUKA|nr:hypothetical protein M0813_03260 [Anaeramoeba flamelloides]